MIDLGRVRFRTEFNFLFSLTVKKEVKGWIREVVLYLCQQNEQLIPKIFEVYEKTSKKDVNDSLKALLSDFLTEHTDIDTIKLTQEMPVIISLLRLHLEMGLGPI